MIINMSLPRITDIRGINVLYLAFLMLSLDRKEEISLVNFFKVRVEKLKEKCNKKNPLKDVRAEYINEVDKIFKNYVKFQPVQV